MTDGRSEREKMLAGDLYRAVGPEIEADQARAGRLMHAYNTEPDAARRQAMLREILAEAGEGTVIRPPFHFDYGWNIRMGRGCFLNFGCVFLDVVAITLGEGCQLGPGVQVYTADHPREAALRRQGLEFGRPVTIGANVWVGGGAIILPGVTLGDDAIIGAGSVVTRDVPAGATVAGNPARTRP
jgi:maltose O-acetyltransferase